MNQLASLTVVASLLASFAVGCVAEDGGVAAPTDDSTEAATYPYTPGTVIPGFLPKSCKEIVTRVPSAQDGEYALFIQGQESLRWTAYCADMQSAPREYLTLVHTGGGKNTSMYAAGGTSPGTDVVTEYQKVRIDYDSLAIDVGDQTFAHSTGSLKHAGSLTVTSMPFGVVATCGAPAKMNVDLSGTPFHPEDSFPKTGANAVAHVEMSKDRRSLDFTISGACGFIAPDILNTDPYNDTGDFVLGLGYLP